MFKSKIYAFYLLIIHHKLIPLLMTRIVLCLIRLLLGIVYGHSEGNQKSHQLQCIQIRNMAIMIQSKYYPIDLKFFYKIMYCILLDVHLILLLWLYLI